MAIPLLENGNTTGDWKKIPAGSYAWTVQGTFGGATVKLQIRDPQNVAIDLPLDLSATAAKSWAAQLPECEVRLVVTGGTPSGLFSYLTLMPGG